MWHGNKGIWVCFRKSNQFKLDFMSMDIRKIKKLIEMLQESDLTEIEVTEGEEAVRISRKSSNDFEVIEKPVQERKAGSSSKYWN